MKKDKSEEQSEILKKINQFNPKGHDWYEQVNKLAKSIGREYGINHVIIAGLMAAFSPMTSWKLSIRLVHTFLSTGNANYLGNQIDKAQKILDLRDGELDDLVADIEIILGGRKTKSFFHNIVFPTTSNKLTLDVHMWRAFRGLWQEITPKRYTFLENEFNKFSTVTNIPVPSVQSDIWVQVRGAEF